MTDFYSAMAQMVKRLFLLSLALGALASVAYSVGSTDSDDVTAGVPAVTMLVRFGLLYGAYLCVLLGIDQISEHPDEACKQSDAE